MIASTAMKMLCTLSAALRLKRNVPGGGRDIEISQCLDQFAADQVEALRKAEKLAARDDPCCDAARGIEHAERGDECGQPETDRDERVDRAGEACRRTGRRRIDIHRVEAHRLHREGGDGAAHRKHRSDRKVDIAIGDHEGEADGQECHLGKGEDEIE